MCSTACSANWKTKQRAKTHIKSFGPELITHNKIKAHAFISSCQWLHIVPYIEKWRIRQITVNWQTHTFSHHITGESILGSCSGEIKIKTNEIWGSKFNNDKLDSLNLFLFWCLFLLFRNQSGPGIFCYRDSFALYCLAVTVFAHPHKEDVKFCWHSSICKHFLISSAGPYAFYALKCEGDVILRESHT